MAEIAIEPFILNDVTLKIGADNYEAHVSAVEFVPSSSPVTWKGLTPSSSFTFPTSATWVCNLTYAQDWKTPNSLSRYLHEHEGATVAVELYPKAGDGETGFAATLVITPGSIGGAGDAVAVASVSLGVSGRPEEIDGP